eukprot:TRINITY_DN40358_c0_g1_i1.p1 TRINITY_DN40358_c0_g1~~TRINITY_DN40358_c0_g1_i1.p1  ORF type:complete len:349 (+),score=64.13 TRINITY_DN40358_c0_g1_i1:120-1166(+)
MRTMWRRLVTKSRETVAATAAVAAAASMSRAGPTDWRRLPGLRCQAFDSGELLAAGGKAEFQAVYELEEEVGRGSSSIVQRARHVPTGQYRAVKRLPSSLLDKKSAPYSSEVEVLASLNHPNIVMFFEYFATCDELLVVEELCAGGALETFLQRALGRGLGAGELTATSMQQMLAAVQHCHENGLVHRDVKPDNFVFSSSDVSPVLKLVDFGLADRCGCNEELEGSAGTVDYSPPEVLAETASFGPAADIWALGAIFFLLLTGEPLIKYEQPVCDTSNGELQKKAAQERLLDPQYINLRVQSACSRVPPDAGDLLREMLEQDPRIRITAAEALKHPYILSRVAHKPVT